jgi:hypothetical protein
MRQSFEMYEPSGNEGAMASVGADLGRLMYESGRVEDAISWIERSEAIAAADDSYVQITCRSLRARFSLMRGCSLLLMPSPRSP